eukprot:g4667.t1
MAGVVRGMKDRVVHMGDDMKMMMQKPVDGLLDHVRYHTFFWRRVPPGVVVRNRLHAASAVLSILAMAMGIYVLHRDEWTVHRDTVWDMDQYKISPRKDIITKFGLYNYCIYNQTWSLCLDHHLSADVDSTCYYQDHAAGCIQFNTDGEAKEKKPMCNGVAAVCDYRGKGTKRMLIAALVFLPLAALASLLAAFEVTGWQPAHYRAAFLRLEICRRGGDPASPSKRHAKKAEKAWLRFRKTRVRRLHAASKFLTAFGAVSFALSSMFWGSVHFLLRQSVGCTPTDSDGCPVYGIDFKLQLSGMALGLGAFIALALQKNKFTRLAREDVDERRNASPAHHRKTKLILAQELADLEDKGEAALMVQSVFRGKKARARVKRARTTTRSGYIGAALDRLEDGANAVINGGLLATAAAGKMMQHVPGAQAAARAGRMLGRGAAGAGTLVAGVGARAAGAVRGGMTGIGLLPKGKRRRRSTTRASSRAGGGLGGAEDEVPVFPLFPLDPFETTELLVAGMHYGNVKHFSQEVTLQPAPQHLVVCSVPGPGEEEEEEEEEEAQAAGEVGEEGRGPRPQ